MKLKNLIVVLKALEGAYADADVESKMAVGNGPGEPDLDYIGEITGVLILDNRLYLVGNAR